MILGDGSSSSVPIILEAMLRMLRKEADVVLTRFGGPRYQAHLRCDISSVFASSTTSLAIVDGVLELCDGALSQHIYRQAAISHPQQQHAVGSHESSSMFEDLEAKHDGLNSINKVAMFQGS